VNTLVCKFIKPWSLVAFKLWEHAECWQKSVDYLHHIPSLQRAAWIAILSWEWRK
jgi:hypothetical protein